MIKLNDKGVTVKIELYMYCLMFFKFVEINELDGLELKLVLGRLRRSSIILYK